MGEDGANVSLFPGFRRFFGAIGNRFWMDDLEGWKRRDASADWRSGVALS
jgi:hypothetical protein